MSFFPMPMTAELQHSAVTTDRSGQQIEGSWTTYATVKCLYLATSGNKKAQFNETFESVVAFYVEPLVDIEEGTRIINIRDKRGNVVEEGPFEAVSVKKVLGFSGVTHHKSLKLRGVA